MESQTPVSAQRTKRADYLRWPRTPTGTSLVGFSQVGVFVILLFYTLHELKSVLMPLVLAILVSLILHPVYAAFRKLKLPRLLSSAITVLGLVAIMAFGGYQAVLPGTEWAKNVDQEEVIGKVQRVFQPVKEVRKEIKEMAKRVETATKDNDDLAADANKVTGESDSAGAAAEEAKEEKFPDKIERVREAPFIDPPEEVEPEKKEKAANAPVMVEIHEDPVTMLMAETRDFGLGLVAFLLLVLFILAYGNRITRELNQDENVAAILERMGADVSRYLFTITIINAGLGICIGLAMWSLGMPRPGLWGVMAMLLNFIPYVGALMGTFVVFMAAAVNFEQPSMVLAVPLVYFGLTAIEGNLITPTVLGGRFKVNPLIVFVWIFAWAGFWGIAGMLIAMPALVIFKIVCENTDKMEKLRRVLGA